MNYTTTSFGHNNNSISYPYQHRHGCSRLSIAVLLFLLLTSVSFPAAAAPSLPAIPTFFQSQVDRLTSTVSLAHQLWYSFQWLPQYHSFLNTEMPSSSSSSSSSSLSSVSSTYHTVLPGRHLLSHPSSSSSSLSLQDGDAANITDVYKGKWERWHPAKDSLVLQEREGDVGMRITADPSQILNEWNYVTGDVVLRDGHYISDADWRYLIAGVYHNTTGTLYIRAHPPHTALHPDRHPLPNATAQDAFLTLRAERHLNDTDDSHSNDSNDKGDDNDDGDIRWYPDLSPRHQCLYAGTFQVHPRSRRSLNHHADQVQGDRDKNKNKNKNRNRNGVSSSPNTTTTTTTTTTTMDGDSVLNMTGTMTSTNCNVTLHVADLSSFNFDHLYHKAVNYASMAILMSFVQVMLLVRQIDFTGTQSSASRVSLLTVGMNANLDAYLCLIHLTVGMIMEPVFNVFAIISFLKFVAASIFSMRYMLNIWKARRPQSFADGWVGVRRELSSLYTRLYGAFLLGIVLMYQLSRLGPYILIPLYSFWAPQIYCTASRNAPKSLSPKYVIGMTLCRLPIMLYFFACPENIMNVRPAPTLCIILSAWLLVQMGIVLMQHYFGPRFFIPKIFQPPKYNYRRPVPPSAIEEGEMNCVICLSPIETDEQHPIHMITPCDHVFHEECLQQWMEIRLECPTCRRVLPET